MQTVCTPDNKSKSALSMIQTFTTPMKLGDDAITGGSGMELFPNPASEQVSISVYSHQQATGKLLITDVFGKILISEPMLLEVGLNEKEAITSDLASGIYFVTVETGSLKQTRKLVIE